MPIAAQIEALFRDAEPRLWRIARAQHVAPDAVADIVQETLLEAWKSLGRLRDEARFAAWLDGICRNIIRRYQRQQSFIQACETTIDDADAGAGVFDDLADPNAFDIAEELTRQDMALLLDRAMGYLTPQSRVVIERHYLTGTPQPELAAEMGISLSALEARLHRARTQLLHILNSKLRADALALGLALHREDAMTWRETRIWCLLCGRQRMRGIFEQMPDGRVNLQLYCPDCRSLKISSRGLTDLTTARSFVPALKRVTDEIGKFYARALDAGGYCRCWVCGQPAQLHITPSIPTAYGAETRIVSVCACEDIASSAASAFLHLPPVKDFLFNRDRVVLCPDSTLEFAGQPAIRFGLRDITSGAHAYVFAHAETLRPLSIVIE